jgi:hypothetical protein
MKAYIPAGAMIATTILLVSLTSPASADTASDPQPDQTGRWVAMGDSFQSGVGAGDYHDDSGDCRRSPSSHVEILHSEGTFPGDLDFVACSGARIEHLYNGQHGEPPQLDALDTGNGPVSHVTVGIGGNDLNFADNLLNCILNLVPWSSCEDRFDENVDDAFQELMQQNADGLNAFQQVYGDVWGSVDRSETTLLALTYPKFFPPDGGSDWTSIPLQPRCQGIRVSDQLWINNWIQRLNTALSESAQSMGGVPVDLYTASDGHELCHPDGDENYLNGIRLSSDAFHPTQFGYARNADVLRPHLLQAATTHVPLRMTSSIELPQPPEADVHLTQEHATVTLDATGSTAGDSAIETYLWELDDDTLVSGAEASHTYEEPGTYYITLTVIDGNEEMGFSAPVEVVVE